MNYPVLLIYLVAVASLTEFLGLLHRHRLGSPLAGLGPREMARDQVLVAASPIAGTAVKGTPVPEEEVPNIVQA